MSQVSRGGRGLIPTLAASVAVRRAPKTAAFLPKTPGRFFLFFIFLPFFFWHKKKNPPAKTKNKTTKVPGCVLHFDLAALCAAPPSLPDPARRLRGSRGRWERREALKFRGIYPQKYTQNPPQTQPRVLGQECEIWGNSPQKNPPQIHPKPGSQRALGEKGSVKISGNLPPKYTPNPPKARPESAGIEGLNLGKFPPPKKIHPKPAPEGNGREQKH